MDQLLLFLQERWLIVLIAIVVLFIVIRIARTVMKWFIVLAIIAAILIYGFNYTI